jgi:hypothetical protein
VAIFDQRGQQVKYQWNAAGDINFGAVQNRADFVSELEKVQAEVARAQEAGAIDEEQAADVDNELRKAVIQAKKPDPNQKSLVSYLNTAKAIVADIQFLAGAAGALGTAIQAAQHLF